MTRPRTHLAPTQAPTAHPVADAASGAAPDRLRPAGPGHHRPLLAALLVVVAALIVPACEGLHSAYDAGMFDDVPEVQP